MELTTEEKIKRYNYEEVMLILFILSSDVSKYSEDDLLCFAENIEGRIDILFTSDFLVTLDKYLTISPSTLEDFITLKDCVVKSYSNNLHKKMGENSEEMNVVKTIAVHILKSLDVNYVEPKEYIDNHLEVDWA